MKGRAVCLGTYLLINLIADLHRTYIEIKCLNTTVGCGDFSVVSALNCFEVFNSNKINTSKAQEGRYQLN